ncbi:MAG: BON domain-containing protein [Verrucomicrobiales bacterium]|nr:BON domain-containing protein [Verrucomicrobiales bacterium]
MKTILSLGTVLLLSVSPTQVLAAIPTISESDARIERSARSSYVFRNFLKYDSITVSSITGSVKISGTVADVVHRSLAEDTVASIAGVTNIENQVTVQSKTQGEESDGLTYSRVKTALRSDRDLVTSRIAVEVKDGLATLCGTASGLLQKDKAARIAKEIPGVLGVKNLLIIRAAALEKGEAEPVSIDDASLAALGKSALLLHRSTARVTAKIQTTHGVITATGAAKSPTEKAAVTRVLSQIIGSKGVVNQMHDESGESAASPLLPPTNLRIVVQ